MSISGVLSPLISETRNDGGAGCLEGLVAMYINMLNMASGHCLLLYMVCLHFFSHIGWAIIST